MEPTTAAAEPTRTFPRTEILFYVTESGDYHPIKL